ncbi:hypothetical protein [Paenibacillus thermotolerans]|uniref:hypothetical protein n=1 Tax=Paenibacillus thermotolerans TaxID=3027807 RepID=UPI00236759AC|nr:MULTISPECIES: hypothetical protein [unclassified Paenibacillus]
MEHSRKQELAFLYLQGALEPEDKAAVFQLILHDEPFRECLKLEVELRENMKRLSAVMDDKAKQKLLAEIQRKADRRIDRTESKEPEWLQWSEWALRLTLPPVVYPIMKRLQRRLFV